MTATTADSSNAPIPAPLSKPRPGVLRDLREGFPVISALSELRATVVVTDSMTVVEEQAVYSIIGHKGFDRLVAAFYRQVPHDDILGPMYEGRDLKGAEQRLRDFLIFRFGGPPNYLEERGHPRLRMRHIPFPIDTAARDRWVRLMTTALDETNLPPSADRVLRSFFASTATFLINQAEP
jgi:hemoglobin